MNGDLALLLLHSLHTIGLLLAEHHWSAGHLNKPGDNLRQERHHLLPENLAQSLIPGEQVRLLRVRVVIRNLRVLDFDHLLHESGHVLLELLDLDGLGDDGHGLDALSAELLQFLAVGRVHDFEQSVHALVVVLAEQ